MTCRGYFFWRLISARAGNRRAYTLRGGHVDHDRAGRALASKYLHFHVPRLFFIYDSRAVEGMRAVSQIVGRVSSYSSSGDKEYSSFAEKCSRLRKYCKAEFGAELSCRQLDNLLLALYEV
jgi:hypothetical protein